MAITAVFLIQVSFLISKPSIVGYYLVITHSIAIKVNEKPAGPMHSVISTNDCSLKVASISTHMTIMC